MGVLLVRNSAWSRRFWEELAHEARAHPHAQACVLMLTRSRVQCRSSMHWSWRLQICSSPS